MEYAAPARRTAQRVGPVSTAERAHFRGGRRTGRRSTMRPHRAQRRFRHAYAMGLEGVSKRATSRYEPGRCDAWRKVKNPRLISAVSASGRFTLMNSAGSEYSGRCDTSAGVSRCRAMMTAPTPLSPMD